MRSARENWLWRHGRKEQDVMVDSYGEYICAETTWIDRSTVCEVRMYLPSEMQRTRV